MGSYWAGSRGLLGNGSYVRRGAPRAVTSSAIKQFVAPSAHPANPLVPNSLEGERIVVSGMVTSLAIEKQRNRRNIMRKSLLTSAALAVLATVFVLRAAPAASFVHVKSSMIASPNRRLAQQKKYISIMADIIRTITTIDIMHTAFIDRVIGAIIDLFNAEGEVDMLVFMRNLSSLKMDAAEAARRRRTNRPACSTGQ